MLWKVEGDDPLDFAVPHALHFDIFDDAAVDALELLCGGVLDRSFQLCEKIIHFLRLNLVGRLQLHIQINQAILNLGFLLFQFFESIQEGVAVAHLCDRGGGMADFLDGAAEFGGQGIPLFLEIGLACLLVVDLSQFQLLDGLWPAEIGHEFVSNSVFEGILRNGGRIAVAGSMAAAAAVIFVDVAFGVVNGSVQGVAAAGAVHQAGEGEAGSIPSVGGHLIFLVAFFIALVDFLDGQPGFLRDDRFAVILDDHIITVLQDPDIERVAKEGGEGVLRPEELGFLGDLAVGDFLGPQLPGFADQGGEVRIRNPAVADVRFAVSVGGDDHFFPLEAFGRRARDAAVLFYQIFQAALGVFFEVIDVGLVHPVDGGLEEAAFGALGDIVVDGVEGDAAPAEICPVELGVIDVAGEAGPFPDDQALLLSTVGAHVAQHGFELAAPGCGGSCAGVFEDSGEDVIVAVAPVAELDFLLFYGELLGFVAGIAEVGHQEGSRGKWGGGHLLISAHFLASSAP